jgi:hypothetical protein
MTYGSQQLSSELSALNQNKEIAFQQYHKICGAIEMVEAMQKICLENEKALQAKKDEEEKAAEINNAATMDSAEAD